MKTASQLQPKPPRPLLAYLVSDGDPESQIIIFARWNVSARRQGANEIGADFGSVTCRRERWADQYAGQTFIPAEAYVDNGWWVGCSNCGAMVSDDSAGEDDEGNTVPHEPVYCGRNLYCDPSCQEAEQAEKTAAARRQQEVIDATLAEFPGVAICSVSDHETDRWVRFKFPGSLGAATWRMGESTLLTANRDQEAWTAYRTANPRAEQ
jgi:hypothetical protein